MKEVIFYQYLYQIKFIFVEALAGIALLFVYHNMYQKLDQNHDLSNIFYEFNSFISIILIVGVSHDLFYSSWILYYNLFHEMAIIFFLFL